MLAAPFHSPGVWLLFGACIVSAALGEVADAVAIGAIVIINGVVGFFQAYRAERAVSAEPAAQRDRGDDGQAS